MLRHYFSEQFASVIFQTKNLLMVGAGGLGCEVSKFLSTSGFRRLEIVDLDVIEYSNLNRQFYFDESDMWKPKSAVIARVLRNRFGWC